MIKPVQVALTPRKPGLPPVQRLRDELTGRLLSAEGTLRSRSPTRKSKIRCAVPAHVAKLSKKELEVLVLGLEFQAAWLGLDPIAMKVSPSPKLEAANALAKAREAETLEAVKQVIRRFALQQVRPSSERMALEVTAMLGRSVSSRTMRQEPHFSAWQRPTSVPPPDKTPLEKRLSRMNEMALRRRWTFLKGEISAAEAALLVRIVDEPRRGDSKPTG